MGITGVNFQPARPSLGGQFSVGVNSYTDFDIIAAIEAGFLTEQSYFGRGRPAEAAREDAGKVVALLRKGERASKVTLSKRLFISVNGPDALLSLMGLRSDGSYGMFAIRQAYRWVHIDASGNTNADAPVQETGTLHYHMRQLCKSQCASNAIEAKVVRFDPFNWIHSNTAPD